MQGVDSQLGALRCVAATLQCVHQPPADAQRQEALPTPLLCTAGTCGVQAAAQHSGSCKCWRRGGGPARQRGRRRRRAGGSSSSGRRGAAAHAEQQQQRRYCWVVWRLNLEAGLGSGTAFGGCWALLACHLAAPQNRGGGAGAGAPRCAALRTLPSPRNSPITPRL